MVIPDEGLHSVRKETDWSLVLVVTEKIKARSPSVMVLYVLGMLTAVGWTCSPPCRVLVLHGHGGMGSGAFVYLVVK